MNPRLSLTLNKRTVAVLEEANAIFKFEKIWGTHWRQALLDRAMYALAREMCREKTFGLPFAVTIRSETKEEASERVGRPTSPYFLPWSPAFLQMLEKEDATKCIIKIDFKDQSSFGWS